MRKRPPLTALRTFEAAAYHGSFAKAAEELSVTPTAVSHQIKQLEELIGQTLFRRFPRPITLTRTGEILYPVLRKSFDEISGVLDSIDHPQSNGPLVISTTTAFAGRWLLPRLVSLKEQTGLELDIQASESRSNLRANEVDFAVRYCIDEPQDVAAHLIARDSYIAVASPKYLALHREGKLTETTLIHYQWKNMTFEAPDWEKYQKALFDAGIGFNSDNRLKDLRFSEESHAIEAAIAGQGIAVVSDILVKEDLVKDNLERVFDVEISGLCFYVVHLCNSPRETDIQEFILWARDEIMDTEERLNK